MRKKILLLGSTGSIGNNTLSVIEQNPDDFELVGISAHASIDLLNAQIAKYKPRYACVSGSSKKFKLSYDRRIKVFTGHDGLRMIVRESDADIVVNGIVGAAGLLPTIDAIETGKHIALANKESLVVAGKLVIEKAKKNKVDLRPIDSEHSAIWQCLIGESRAAVKRILLTASGGPFVNRSASTLHSVTIEEALNHPKWKMGNKITIDSATLMNKGFEVIEAHWLFGMAPHHIKVLIHPQSIIHSMVEFIDGSFKAQLGIPDMRIPIQFALTYPERRPCINNSESFFTGLNLTFQMPNENQFPCLTMAYKSIEAGGTMPAVLNAANEVAVDMFLHKQIKFSDIHTLIDNVLQRHIPNQEPALEDLLEADTWARTETRKKVL